MTLPAADVMSKAVDEEKEWKGSWMPATGARASIFQLHKTKYHDRICKDIGVPHRRKGMNILAEAFAPYSARDYEALFEQKQEAPQSKVAPDTQSKTTYNTQQ